MNFNFTQQAKAILLGCTFVPCQKMGLSITYYFLLLISFIPLSVVLSQPKQVFQFTHLSTDKGISNSHVHKVFQDRKGFVWVGTENGLNRYNGVDFEVFKSIPFDSTSLQGNTIYDMVEADNGQIYIATSAGLNIYDYHRNTFQYQWLLPKTLVISDLLFDQQKGLWIATKGEGIFYAQYPTLNFVNIRKEDGLPSNYIQSIFNDHKGTIWLATADKDQGSKIATVTPASFKVTDVKGINIPAHTAINEIMQDKRKNIWLATEGEGAFRYNPFSHQLDQFLFDPLTLSLPDNRVYDLLEDQKGQLWLATAGGLSRWVEGTDIFESFRHDPNNVNSLSNYSIRSVDEDRQGNLWVGVHQSGLDLMTQQYNDFHAILSGKHKNQLSPSSVIACFQDRQKRLWLGLDGMGINILDENGALLQKLDHDSGLKASSVFSIYEDKKGIFWLGTYDQGLVRYDESQQQFTYYRHDPLDEFSLSHNDVRDILEDSKGNFWVLTNGGGLNLFDVQTGRFKHFRYSTIDPEKGICSDYGICLKEDSKGAIWIGTYGGLSQLLPEDFSFKNYTHDRKDKTSLSNNWVFSLLEDHEKRLWVGTANGLNLFSLEEKGFRHFYTGDGLPDNVITGIEQDLNHTYWLSTHKGLAKVNISEYPDFKWSINVYGVYDDLQGREYSKNASLVTDQDQILFAGVNGINLFHPDDIQGNTYVPEVVISGLTLNGQSHQKYIGTVLPKHITECEQVVLPFAYNTLSFSFAVLNFVVPQKNQYAFKLEGVDTKWQMGKKGLSASYSNLAPGTYVFKVKGANNDGVWNEQGDQVTVIILPPVYLTWYAYLFYFAVICLMVYWFRYFSLQRLKVENRLKHEQFEREKLEEINRLKLKFFTNITHEIRTSLTLVNGPLQNILKSESMPLSLRDRLGKLLYNAQRMQRLLNEVLNFRKLEAEKMVFKYTRRDIIPFLQEIKDSFDDMAMQQEVNFEFQSNQTSLQVDFDVYQMENVVFNLLSNALKWCGRQGTVILRVEKLTEPNGVEWVVLKVKDSGKGIDNALLNRIFDRFFQIEETNHQVSYGTGLGLSLSKRIIEKHGGSIQVLESGAEGTTFEVMIPVVQENYQLDVANKSTKAPEKAEQFSVFENNGKVTILVVEDDADVAAFLVDILVDFKVAVAANGQLGLIKAKELVPDLIISDLSMPAMDGFEFCKAVKSDIHTSHIPFMILSAQTADSSEIKGFKAGADAYLTKPFNPDVLLTRIARFTNKRPNDHFEYKPLGLPVVDDHNEFLLKVNQMISENILNQDFKVESIEKEIGVSRPILIQKIKALTGKTMVEYINTIRLQKASMLLVTTSKNVSEIAYEVGFNDPKYFSKSFRKVYGITPSGYRNSVVNGS